MIPVANNIAMMAAAVNLRMRSIFPIFFFISTILEWKGIVSRIAGRYQVLLFILLDTKEVQSSWKCNFLKTIKVEKRRYSLTKK